MIKYYNTEKTLVDYESYIKSTQVEATNSKPLKFIRILGCSGSGKSELFRQLYIQDPDWFFLVQPHPIKKGSLERLFTVFPNFKCVVVGCYVKYTEFDKFYKEDKNFRSLDWYNNDIFVTSGGADSLKDNSIKIDRIYKGWFIGYDLYIEGSIIASQDDFVLEQVVENNRTNHIKRVYVDALVQPSLEIALERIQARGSKMYKDDKTTRAKHRWFSNKMDRLSENPSRKTVRIDSGQYNRQSTVKNVLKVINNI